jgi:hypothetical protein
LSLIVVLNGIAKLGLAGNEPRKGDAIVAPPFVTKQPKFRDDLRSGDPRKLSA